MAGRRCVFLGPDGSGPYPAYAGFDKDMQVVTVLVDLAHPQNAFSHQLARRSTAGVPLRND
jgi:hypothetical protein